MDPNAAKNASSAPRFAIVTPSYYVDFERCQLLCESVVRFVPPEVRHYLVVDRADRALFAPLASSRTKLLFKEDVLGGRFHQLPFARKWWIGPWGMPVRGWMVQQLTKLSMHRVADEDVFAFVDSGALFVKPYDPRTTVKDGRVPLFRETHEGFKTGAAREWHEIAAKLLGIKPIAGYDYSFVKTFVTWRRDNLEMMHQHMERVAGRPSIETLSRLLNLSEYCLYGMYCDLVLGDRARHYHTNIIETLSHWELGKLTVEDLRRLREKLAPEHQLVMINEKSHTPLAAVREAFFDS